MNQVTTIVLAAVATGVCLGLTPNRAGAEDGGGLTFGESGGLKYETPDKRFAFQVGGRVQVDGAVYDEDVAPLASGTELRRTRLFVAGVLYGNWAFKGQYDFAGNSASVNDAYLLYIGLDPLAITVGNFKEPFSLENLTSSKYVTFTERALAVDAFRPARTLGLAATAHGANWTAALGGFGQEVGDAPETDDDGNEQDSGWGVTARGTFSPIYGDDRFVHLGASATYRAPGDAEGVSFSDRPETHVTDVRLVETGTIADTDDFQIYDLEAAAAFGAFSVQGEYLLNQVNADAGDADLDGWYIYGTVFLTGDSRAEKYSPESGKFGRLKPQGPYGAVEVAVRYSTIDLSDGPVDGGEEDNVAVGVNWYVNPYVRLSANYVRVVDHERQGVSDEPEAFQARAQIDF